MEDFCAQCEKGKGCKPCRACIKEGEECPECQFNFTNCKWLEGGKQ